MKLKLIGTLLLLSALGVQAQQKIIPLYPGAAPGSENWTWTEGESDNNAFNTKVLYNVTHPSLSVFLPDSAINTGTAVVICPGGGFHTLSINSEGYDVAKWLNKQGVTCFVLKYRLTHSLTNDPVKELIAKMAQKDFPKQVAPIVPLGIADARAALAYVREHAAEYHVSPQRIGIMGFSAGGTLASAAAFNYTAANKPDFDAPIYAYVPPELLSKIPDDAPPMFIAAATDDQLDLAPHSVELYNKWLASKHSAELHMYVKGGHGFGMRKQNLPTDTWIDRFNDWLELQGLLKPVNSQLKSAKERTEQWEAYHKQWEDAFHK
ncbi:alpha/beta hydrolase, partial [Mucilaginibacter sp.]|uniref:alpha/beta hydrolase n=1 Tax=Mucilaginibacter sp. TaxID=1882438 RepID=UPI002ED2890A